MVSKTEAIEKEDGNTDAFEPFYYVEPARGVATHAYAAFDPTLKGTSNARTNSTIRTF